MGIKIDKKLEVSKKICSGFWVNMERYNYESKNSINLSFMLLGNGGDDVYQQCLKEENIQAFIDTLQEILNALKKEEEKHREEEQYG